MDIKFPEQENPFPKTMATAVFSVIAALLIGMFLGNALGAFFGTDESVITTTDFTDRMSAVRTMFTDPDQMDSYANTALTFQNMEGLKLYSSRNHDKFMAIWEGEMVDPATLFDERVQKSLEELLRTEDALWGVETSGGSQIDDIQLYNIAVSGGVVYYYLYYAEAGYVGLAFDSTGVTLKDKKDDALVLTQTPVDSETGAGGEYEWFITYLMED